MYGISNDIVYFNPTEALGVGTIAGIGSTSSYTVGEVEFSVSTPTQSIYLPNHPFKTNQKVVFAKGTSVLQVKKDLSIKETVKTNHHDEPRYIFSQRLKYL